nr:hypothetical protein [Brevibacillus laterosporus]
MLETDVFSTLTYNEEYHQQILGGIEEGFSVQPATLEEGLTWICEKRGITIQNMTSYVLFRTAFMG